MQKQVSPKVTIALILLTLLVVQFAFWRRLVFQRPAGSPSEMRGMRMPPAGPPIPVGLAEVSVTTFAGDATPGYQDGDALLSRFHGPSAVVADDAGNLFVSDSRNHRIRRLTPQGKVSTIAGSGETGTATGGFADGVASKARFWCPSGLAWHPQRGLYVADTGNHLIRLLTPQGEVKTIAGGDTPRDAQGRFIGGDVDGPGDSARFRFPTGLVLDSAGNLYVADTGNHSVRKITLEGATVTTLARLATVSPQILVTREASADPGPPDALPPLPVKTSPTSGKNVATPTNLMVDKSGSVLVADAGNQCLWEIPPGGAAQMVVEPPKSEMQGTDASHFLRPTGLTSGGDGAVYVTDTLTNCVLRWQRQQGILLIAGRFWATPIGGYLDGQGTRSAFATPCSLTVVGRNIFVADFGNNCIRKVSGAVME